MIVEKLHFTGAGIRATARYRAYHLLMLVAPLCGALYIPVCYYAMKLIVDAIAVSDTVDLRALAWPIGIGLFADVTTGLAWRLATLAAWRSEPFVRRGIIVGSVDRLLSYRHGFFQSAPVGGLVSKVKALSDGYDDMWSQISAGMTTLAQAILASAASIAWVDWRLGAVMATWIATCCLPTRAAAACSTG